MSILNESNYKIRANGLGDVLVGTFYGELLVLRSPVNETVKGKALVECGCFGKELVEDNLLLSGDITMCSLCRKTRIDGRHGCAGTTSHTAWLNMRQRCTNPNHMLFKHYGNRGIRVCQEWLDSYKPFMSDMGEQPEGMTLERVDNNQGYFPWNCKWDTQQEQSQNTRRIKLSRDSVQVIRLCHKLGVEISVLAGEFNIESSGVRLVLDGKTWSNIK